METCPKSGLLISRCRCPQHRVPKRFLHIYECRRVRLRRRRDHMRFMGGSMTGREYQTKWMNEIWKQHAQQHPEMWSEEAKRGWDN